MVGQALQALARKGWAQDVAQEAGARWLVEGASAGSGVEIEPVVLHDEVPHDFRATAIHDADGVTLAFGRARGDGRGEAAWGRGRAGRP
jgi:hypothetical protein